VLRVFHLPGENRQQTACLRRARSKRESSIMTTRLCVLLALALLCTPMAALSLTGTQRRQLRAIAGRREAAKTLQRMKVVEPARSAAEVDTVLRASELVRCKFPVLHKRDVPPLAEELAGLVDPPAEVAQVLGHTALLYRPAVTPEIILET
jgi:RNA-binding protein YhbY